MATAASAQPMSILHCLQAKLSPLKAEHARLLGIDGYLKIPGKASKLKEVKEHVLALIIHRMDLHSMPDGGPDLFDSGQKGVIRCLYICTLALCMACFLCFSVPIPPPESQSGCRRAARHAICLGMLMGCYVL